jgi:hypothetical protein
MAALFVSHSSKDDAALNALEAWLDASGFTDIFIDHQCIAGGDKWREELRKSAATCRVVICLVTENWLASDQCFGEFVAGSLLGKRIIPLFWLPSVPCLGEVETTRLAQISAEDQGVKLNSCVRGNGLLDFEADPSVARRLKVGLRAAGALSRVGLDPEAFAIDHKLRPMPFPGLTSFADADADAALFYGRSREIAETLEALRKMRAADERQPFVILGASGAGKSSLLKAGIIPRLRRETPAWLPLRAFRPGADPLLNFAEALARTFGDFGKVEAPGVIRDRLFDAWSKAERMGCNLTALGRAGLETALETEGLRLRDASHRDRAASILVSIDQAEEMARVDGGSGDALADYLRAALAMTTSRWQVALTIRTDSFSELQSHRRFRDLEARAYDLRAIPVFRFDSVVEEPARRYGVLVDHTLVDALMEDAPKEDALPLLAFALQRLWRQYAASGALIRDNYDKVGGLKGLIEDSAERALCGLAPEEEVALPAAGPPRRRSDLAASAFVPALAQISDKGTTVRRIAQWSSFDEEQQDILTRFEQWRLVVRKGEENGGTVEVAHEALFREWTRLKSWLVPEGARLEALKSLQIDASNWHRNGRDGVFLNHRNKRLAEAAALASIENYRKRLGTLEFDYLKACQEAEHLAELRESLALQQKESLRRRARANTIYILLVVPIFLISQGLLIGHFLVTADGVSRQRITESVDSELQLLQLQYNQAGVRRLVSLIDVRSKRPGAYLYLVATSENEGLAGNVGSVEPATLDSEGWVETAYRRLEEPEAAEHEALVRMMRLPGGLRLLVGRDLDELDILRNAVKSAGSWSLILLGLVLLGGFFVMRWILSRFDARMMIERVAERRLVGDALCSHVE